MRRSALSIGKMDPVAAWFSYFRVLNWSSNGAVLLWMVSGLGARQSLQHWLRFTAGVSWKSSLGEFLIALGPAWLVYFICIDLSYPVFAQLRGDSSRRAEFLLQHILTVGAQVLPLVLFFTGQDYANVAPAAHDRRTSGPCFCPGAESGGENSAGICDARRQGRDGECLRSSEQHGDLHRLLVAAAYEAGGGCGGGARTHAS